MILKLCKEKTVQMRYKNGIPGVQIFLGYKLFKWGTVPQNGVRLATLLSFMKKSALFFLSLWIFRHVAIISSAWIRVLHGCTFSHSKPDQNFFPYPSSNRPDNFVPGSEPNPNNFIRPPLTSITYPGTIFTHNQF